MIRSAFSSWREYLTPISHTSTFRETGEITPEEFVQAGDYLVYKFPTWQWSSAPAHKRRDFLPANKQVLVTRHVPSHVRAESYLGLGAQDSLEQDIYLQDESGANSQEEGEAEDDEEAWTATGLAPNHASAPRRASSAIMQPQSSIDQDENNSIKEVSSDEEQNDIDDLIDETAEDDDEDEGEEEGDDNTIGKNHSSSTTNEKRRSYDLYITYSTSYRVPKMYLIGFNANGSPLSPKAMFEDIVPDYRHKTATIEKAPFLSNTTSVSIHPCKHATVMKVLMSRAAAAAAAKKEKLAKSSKEQTAMTNQMSNLALEGTDKAAEPEQDTWESVDPDNSSNEQNSIIRVDQYLVIFLKFISSVTPGIEHDYTMDAF